MRSKPTIIALVLLGLVALLAGGAYAYDHAQRGKIAAGLTVGGVQVGGMEAAQARRALEQEIMAPLTRRLVVRRGEHRWTLGPREAQIRADLDAMVEQALARSREGGLVSRVARGIGGGRIQEDLQPSVTYSEAAVGRLVSRVSRAVERTPQDASVRLSGTGIERREGRSGLELRAKTLRRELTAAIVSPTASREFVAHARHVEPKVSNADLAQRYGTVLIVQRSAFRLQLYKRLKLARTYPIAVGQVGLETPAGQYAIQNKAVNPAWHVPNSAWAGDLAGTVVSGDDPSNPIKARWLGIYDGVGIHGTSDDASIGSNASHGCIRMHVSDVEALYPQVPVGTPVYIA